MADDPYLDEVLTYLGDTAYTSEQVNSALVAERAAQARVLRIGEAGPEGHPDLEEALKRRVARNLAMRSLPLGVQTVDEVGGFRVGSTDPEVRRLEAPWRRLVVG